MLPAFLNPSPPSTRQNRLPRKDSPVDRTLQPRPPAKTDKDTVSFGGYTFAPGSHASGAGGQPPRQTGGFPFFLPEDEPELPFNNGNQKRKRAPEPDKAGQSVQGDTLSNEKQQGRENPASELPPPTTAMLWMLDYFQQTRGELHPQASREDHEQLIATMERYAPLSKKPQKAQEILDTYRQIFTQRLAELSILMDPTPYQDNLIDLTGMGEGPMMPPMDFMPCQGNFPDFTEQEERPVTPPNAWSRLFPDCFRHQDGSYSGPYHPQ